MDEYIAVDAADDVRTGGAVKHYVIAVLAAALMGAALIASAPPAGAACQDAQLLLFPTAQKCDDPIQPDGNWRRCVVYYAPPGDPFAQSDCHVMGPTKETVSVPFFDPPTHIGP
jgi:hypothetical protein